MAVLEIRNFTKIYGGNKKAVDNLSLTVEEGDIYGFIGHNGAGKSTTLKAVCGVLAFEEGEIFIDGHSVKKEPVFCKEITAYIPDNPDLYPHLTGVQYLNFICDIFGVGKKERNERIERYADLFELTPDLSNIISSYSHGMKQKLAIIGAFSHEPKLLVMDEPFVGLDPKAAFSVKELLRERCAAGGAVFFSTHVLEVAEKLCNKIAIIKGGRLVADGETKSVVGNESLEETFLELYENEK